MPRFDLEPLESLGIGVFLLCPLWFGTPGKEDARGKNNKQ